MLKSTLSEDKSRAFLKIKSIWHTTHYLLDIQFPHESQETSCERWMPSYILLFTKSMTCKATAFCSFNTER